MSLGAPVIGYPFQPQAQRFIPGLQALNVALDPYGARLEGGPATNVADWLWNMNVIQRALNDAAALGGAIVVIPGLAKVVTQAAIPGGGGNYCLNIPSNVTFMGTGQNNSGIVSTQDAATVLLAQGSADANHVSKVIIRDLSVRSADSTANGIGRGIFLQRADDCMVAGCDVRGSIIGIQCDCPSTDVNKGLRNVIWNNRVHDTFWSGALQGGNGTGIFVANNQRTQIVGNYGYNIAEHGLYIAVSSRDIVVVHNDFRPLNALNQNACIQIFTGSAIPDIDGLILDDNVLVGGKWGIVASTTFGNITDLTIKNSKISGQIGNLSGSAQGEGILLATVLGALVEGNKCKSMVACDGIRADSSRSVQFRGNKVEAADYSGLMFLATTDSEIVENVSINNDQSNSTNYGIRLSGACTGNKISKNICTDYQGGKTQKYGIQSDAAATGNLIDGNTVSGNVTGAISLGSATNVVRDNTGFDVVQGTSADRGDANVTLTPGTDNEIQRFGTALTANRTITLSGINAHVGVRFRIVRYAGGAFNLDVGGLKTLAAANTWADVEFDGVGGTYRLTADGTL